MTTRRPAPRTAGLNAQQAKARFFTHDVEIAGEIWRQTGTIPTGVTRSAAPRPSAPQVPGRGRPSAQLRAAATGKPVTPLATRRARAAKRRVRKAQRATVNAFAALGVMVFVALLLALIVKGLTI